MSFNGFGASRNSTPSANFTSNMPPTTIFGAVNTPTPRSTGFLNPGSLAPRSLFTTSPGVIFGFSTNIKTEEVGGLIPARAGKVDSNAIPSNAVSTKTNNATLSANAVSSRSPEPEPEGERFGSYQPINNTTSGFNFAAFSSAPPSLTGGLLGSAAFASAENKGIPVQSIQIAQAASPATPGINGLAASPTQESSIPGVVFESAAALRPSLTFPRAIGAQKPVSYSFAAVKKSTKKTQTSFSSPPVFIHFKIGPDAQTFTVHKQLAIFHSSYFNEVFTSNQEKDNSQTLSLPETDTSTFGLLVHYLYTEQIEDQPSTLAEPSIENPEMEVSRDPLRLTTLYLLAQRCKITALQNLIIPRLIKILSRSSDAAIQIIASLIFPSSVLAPINTNNNSNNGANNTSLLQNLIVDHTAFCPRSPQQQQESRQSYSEFMDGLPREMIGRIAGRLRGFYDTTVSNTVGGKVVIRVENYLIVQGGRERGEVETRFKVV